MAFPPEIRERCDELIVRSLKPLPQELNELDWKEALSNNTERLKEHLSALANYSGGGFLIFGVSGEGNIPGIPKEECNKILQRLGGIARDGVEPGILLQHDVIEYDGKNLLAVFVPESVEKPVHKRGQSIEFSFIRAGGQTRRMTKQELRMALLTSRSMRFEELPAAVPEAAVTDREKYFDFSIVFGRLKKSQNTHDDAETEFLHSHKLLARSTGKYFPTNLSVLTCAKDLREFPTYEHFAIRVTQYRGNSRLEAQKDMFFSQGYSRSFDEIVKNVVGLLPFSEIMKHATRTNVPVIPEIALREIIGNSIIHRDYSRTDSYTTVDLFGDRVEITNPGGLLSEISIDRLIDHPSRTRNEVLADFMRTLGFGEERGSGIDKVVLSMELHGLPPAKFLSTQDHFTAILYAPREFRYMEKDERINAVYQHACLNFVLGRRTTNSSVRERFKFTEDQSTKVSRLLTDAIDSKRIKVANPKASPRDMHYLPYWS